MKLFDKKIILLVAGKWAVVFMLWSAGLCQAADEGKPRELNRTLAEIKTVAQMVNEKLAIADEARRRLFHQSQELTAEILQERRRHSVSSYRNALLIGRIEYNLRLVQQISGYTERLDNRIGYFRSAVHTLEFLRQQVRDDLMILRTLNDADIDLMARQVAAALEEIKTQCQKPLLTASAGAQRSSEAVWNELVQNDKALPR